MGFMIDNNKKVGHIKITKNIILIILGNAISKIGNAIFDVALIWWLVEKYGSSKYTGYVMVATLFPAVFMSLLGGVIGDRYNKKYIIVISDILSGLASLAMGIMTCSGHLNLQMILLISFALGVSKSLFGPTIRSLIPILVDHDDILRVNSIFSTTSGIIKVIGPLMGAAILSVPFIGVGGAFIINGVSFFASAISEMFISYEFVQDKKSTFNLGVIKEDMKQGFVYIFKDLRLRRLLIGASIANIFLTAFTFLNPLFINNVLHCVVNYYSITLAMESAGGICVGIVLMMIHKKDMTHLKYMRLYIILLGGIVLLTPVSIFFNPIIFILSFFFGAFTVCFDNTYFSYIQINCERGIIGRVISVVGAISNLGVLFSYLVFGLLGDFMLTGSYVVAGICIVLCALLINISEKETV
ncbi:MFS transporter [Cellulosilyticum ruminicola]|uniref:MFS transporter n=1 Tax=Cellulosilyticum ruminicola TaxID=425254 RepID=UPI0006D03B07|nr:MFS transporter [Cellulosilyticum ruminicola]